MADNGFTFTNDADGSDANNGDIPFWEDDIAWSKVILGDTTLAGTAEIEGLSSEIEVETKKPKGGEKPRSKDNGNKPGEFRIILTIATRVQWKEYVDSLPNWHPRRLGRDRRPLVCIHPLVNAHGLREVRVTAVKIDKTPTAVSGLKVTIIVAEWFDKLTTVSKKQDKPVQHPAQDDEFAGWANHGPLPILGDGGFDPAPDPAEELAGDKNNLGTENMFRNMFSQPGGG